MKTETKSLQVQEMDAAGIGLARLADLSAIDSDGDTYTAGAFSWKEGNAQWAPMLPAHNRGAMPFGKAKVFEKDGTAYAELHLNLDTVAGREWHSHLKFDLSTGQSAQEWSYGYGVLDAVNEQRGTEKVRNLKRVDVHEVSPVVRGAGSGTATLAIKSHGGFGGQIDAVIAEIEDIIERAGDVAALRQAEGREMSKARLDQLGQLKARLDELLAEKVADNDDAALAEKAAADFLTRAARRRLNLP